MPPGSGPRHMKFGKDGKQAYVLSELLLNVVVLDRAESGGGLRQKQVVSVLPEGTDKDGMTCSEILVSGDGKFVYTANRDTAGKGRDSLSVLTIRDGGNLTLLQTVPAKVAIPRNINLSPDGKWLLVAGQKSGNVPVFAVGKDGKLSATPHEVKLANAMCVVFGR
jgi:6-phosphogluconolactonase